jgi:ABC-type multidrug transport system fused ATPase/permease subunit
VLLLDEATSNVDMRSEAQTERALDGFAEPHGDSDRATQLVAAAQASASGR